MKIKRKIFFIFYIMIFILSSCTKQEAPTIENGERLNRRELERLEACSQVNFNKGVLLHLNTILLFKCTKWDENFPHMFNSIRGIQSTLWDHLMSPVDEAFISDMNRRNHFFKNIRELDGKNGLDDLSRVIVALNETNFFDSLKTMFLCVDDPANELCKDRKNLPTKKSLTNIIKLIDTNPKTINQASEIIKSLISAIGNNQEKLRGEINKFREDPIFVSARLLFPDAMSRKMQMGMSKEDREFLQKVFLTGNQAGDAPWIYTWIHDEKMNRDKFRDLIEFPILVNPIFVKEIRGVKEAYDSGFGCTVKSTLNPNELVEYDFKTHLGSYANVLKERGYKEYFDYSSSEIVGLKMSSEICSEMETNKFKVNFIKALTSVTSFLGEKKFYELMKFLISHSTTKGDQDKTFAENLYLFDMVASDLFSSANTINEQVVHRTRNFYLEIYDIVMALPVSAYTNFGEVATDLLKEENDKKLKGVADFWSFFSANEKNFLFNFVDRHFEGDTQFVLLFDFYSKFLDDMRDVQPLFKERWMGTAEREELSYLSLQNVVDHLAGKDTLSDFKKFFGRDQILRVLEVISGGARINAMAMEELEYIRSDEYISRSRAEKYKFNVVYNPAIDADYDSRAVVDCMKKFSEIENGFYYLVKKLPEACSKVTNENIAFRLFGWLNTIESTYKEFNPGGTESDSLLNNKGLLSPYMLNTAIGTAKILDTLLGEVDSVLPTKNGIRYVMNSAKYHLEQEKAALLIDQNLEFLTKWLSVLPGDNLIHRNALIKAFTREKNFSQANVVSRNASLLAIDYSEWVKKGNLKKLEEMSFGKYDPKQECEKVINQVIAPYPCPARDVVKRHANGTLKYFTTMWEEDLGTPIGMLLKAITPGEGLDIPLGTRNTERYRFTLKETFQYMYDSSDKSLPINREKVYFVNEQGKGSLETVTTLERIEAVIREVRFDNNYLGAAYLNAITHARDYNDEAKKRKKLLSMCLKIPGIRCSRPMSDNDLRMAKNSLETFDGLIDINNGRGKEAKLNYGNYLKTFQQTLVGTSLKQAQVVQLFPLSDELLLKHNGRLLGEMTLMTMWSNMARVIRDRVGRTPEDFDKFINSESFNRVDKALLYGFYLPEATPSAEKLIKKIQQVPAGEKQNILDHTIDWVASLDYDQTRLLENTVGRLLLLSSYLGSPKIVFNKTDGFEEMDSPYAKYKNNNLLQMFLALEKIVDYWPTLKNIFPKEVKLINAIRPVHNALVFLTDSLASTNDPDKNMAYQLLNDLFLAAEATMFDKLPDPSLLGRNGREVKGLDIFLSFLSNPANVGKIYSVIRGNYHYLDKQHENGALWFKAVGQNIQRITESPRVDLTPIREYLSFTTRNQVCLTPNMGCLPNFHFDEVAGLVKFLNNPSKDSNESNFMVMTRKVFRENFNELTDMLDDLIPAIKIKEVKPPLTRIN